uniref:Uncharacterized protein n=1 Tax=candidate division WOR-3 bacterium TaxID=2052148 RepID=A0A7V3RG80_UNCW3
MNKMRWLSLIGIIGLLLINCGNEPPEEFYNGTPKDDTLINDELAKYPQFLKTDDLFLENWVSVTLPAVSFPVADSYFKGESVLVKMHVDSLRDKIAGSSRFKDLWYAKDTTCTVYLYDTFNLIQEVHYDLLYKGYYFWQGDTGKKIDTVIVETGGGYYSYDTLTAEGLRHLYVEPVREKVYDEETGDSVWKIKEPREWKLKRISYGNYGIPNRGASIPYIYWVILTSKNTGKVDTIWATNYDTLYQHHAMNRFCHIDSLLEYNNEDSLSVNIRLTGQIDSTACQFFAIQDGKKTQLPLGKGKIQVTGSGVKNLVFEVIVSDGLYYQKPANPLLVRLWLIPIRIK